MFQKSYDSLIKVWQLSLLRIFIIIVKNKHISTCYFLLKTSQLNDGAKIKIDKAVEYTEHVATALVTNNKISI